MKFRILIALNIAIWVGLAVSGRFFFEKEIRDFLSRGEPVVSVDTKGSRGEHADESGEAEPSPLVTSEPLGSSRDPDIPEEAPKNTDGPKPEGKSATELLAELQAAKDALAMGGSERKPDGIVYDAASRLGDDKVYAYIRDITGLKRDEIDPGLSAPEAAQILYDKAMESQEAHYLRPIQFGLEVDSQNRVLDPKISFKGDAKRIYAAFEVANLGIKTVVVKWQRVGEEQPFLFIRQGINPKIETNFIWAETKDRWKPGEYLVEVFDPAHRFDPLAGGKYTMEATSYDNVAGP